LVAAAKFLVAATKKLLVVPNFVAVTKPCFPCWGRNFVESFGTEELFVGQVEVAMGTVCDVE